MQPILIDHINQLKTLCEEHHVHNLFAFGSVCTDNFNDSSDIDLLISFHPMEFADYADNYFDMAEKLEDLFQRNVDLETDKSLSNPYFIKSVNKTKTLLYGTRK